VRLFHPAPIGGGGRAPEIGEWDRKPPADAFGDRVGPVLDRELRLEGCGDARGEETLLRAFWQRGERREALGRRQLEPAKIERGLAGVAQTIGRRVAEIVQRAARFALGRAQVERMRAIAEPLKQIDA
jgi:hypothetical protein